MLSPAARHPRMCSTVSRVPRITGLPIMIFGSLCIRGWSIVCSHFLNLRASNDGLAHHDLRIALDAGLGHLCASDVHGNAQSYHESRPVAASLSPPLALYRAHERRRHLGPAARRRAEVDHPPARLEQVMPVIDLDQLEGRARAVAFVPGRGHVGIVELALEPALGGGRALSGGL